MKIPLRNENDIMLKTLVLLNELQFISVALPNNSIQNYPISRKKIDSVYYKLDSEKETF